MNDWHKCKHWIEEALKRNHGTMTIEDVEVGIKSGKYQFVPGNKCALVMELGIFPRKRMLNFLLAGGNLLELQKLELKMTKWAKDQGLDGTLIIGRKGWGRVLPGYSEMSTVYIKEF